MSDEWDQPVDPAAWDINIPTDDASIVRRRRALAPIQVLTDIERTKSSLDGVIVVAEPDSPLRVTATDIMKRAQPYHRAVMGAVLLTVARVAYPDPAMLDDPDRIAVFTTQSVVDALDRAAQAHADASDEDADAEEGSAEVWRRWQELTAARPNARRRSPGDRAGAVNRWCKFLAENGHLTARGETDGGTWLARPRFRHAVAALCEDSELYRLVNGLAEESDVIRPDREAPADEEAIADDE
jgi:hypothetical protein